MFVALATLGGLALLIAAALSLARKSLYVEEDPRVEQVYELLPHSDCGACGFPGCRAFAEALTQAQAPPAACTVGEEQDRQAIASLLHVAVGEAHKRVARLACAGGANVARAQASYSGLATCRAAALVAGGGKSCFWGCLGYGDCEAVCDFDAISMSPASLPVVDEDRCTACGDCVDACPKDLFNLQPIEHRLWVACRNLERGEAVLADCEVACTGCGKCAKDAAGGLIQMRENLAVIDYSKPHAQPHAIDRCPTGAIVWIDPERGPIKGPAAAKIVRTGARGTAPT